MRGALLLQAREQAETELAQSKNDIEVNTGKTCFMVSWPHSVFSDKVLQLLAKTGYRGAATYSGGFNDLGNINLYNIRRVPIVAEIPPQAYADVLELK